VGGHSLPGQLVAQELTSLLNLRGASTKLKRNPPPPIPNPQQLRPQCPGVLSESRVDTGWNLCLSLGLLGDFGDLGRLTPLVLPTPTALLDGSDATTAPLSGFGAGARNRWQMSDFRWSYFLPGGECRDQAGGGRNLIGSHQETNVLGIANNHPPACLVANQGEEGSRRVILDFLVTKN
jgi:hypothetical protein